WKYSSPWCEGAGWRSAPWTVSSLAAGRRREFRCRWSHVGCCVRPNGRGGTVRRGPRRAPSVRAVRRWTRRSRPGSVALSVPERTTVSETGGLLVDGVFASNELAVERGLLLARTRRIPLATSIAMVIERARRERLSILRTRRSEVVHDALPRSRALRGTTPRIWGRRD